MNPDTPLGAVAAATQAQPSAHADIRPSFARVPALDGLLACAILFVLVAHFGFYDVVPGGFGVTLLFFISGLLITRLRRAGPSGRRWLQWLSRPWLVVASVVVLQAAPMRLIGTWSYSLYLSHQLALTLAELATAEHYLAGFRKLSGTWYLISLSATFVLTWLSYYGVERPFLSLRHRFGSRTA